MVKKTTTAQKISTLDVADLPTGVIDLVVNQAGVTKRLVISDLDQLILTSNNDTDPDHLAVKEIYVSKSSGKLVIVFDDGEE